MSTVASDNLIPSASLILVNECNEVLLVQRSTRTRSFAGMHVFPGGNFDTGRDTSLAITAIRETFEETGVLLASPTSPQALSKSDLERDRSAVHRQELDFQAFLLRHKCVPALKSLRPFTTWITPLTSSRRFRTQFFISFFPTCSEEHSSGTGIGRVPTTDGGEEVQSTCFLHPRVAIAEFKKGNINLAPPQYYILETLRQLLPGDVQTPEEREKLILLSQRPFGRLVIRPRLYQDPVSSATMFLYEGDELRGGPVGQLHRVLVKQNGTVFLEINLQRNFDIFTVDVSEAPGTTATKL
ncbi:NUDIX domain-containing protein [Pisolithus orientalis]|uniref:NUDIX domain-containing protein n=1 Tax=Pisolithus orientalis TaxID=936130 RepID=UPI002224EAAF|nr:NUDIX domain-containing protein [Pisolithus orientalis]KAI6028561.1 NUDIX domain-containing protein [Pisolithus orientalis]